MTDPSPGKLMVANPQNLPSGGLLNAPTAAPPPDEIIYITVTNAVPTAIAIGPFRISKISVTENQTAYTQLRMYNATSVTGKPFFLMTQPGATNNISAYSTDLNGLRVSNITLEAAPAPAADVTIACYVTRR